MTERLTPQQRRVAAMIGLGACNKDIAQRLQITERTVKAHLTGIYRSLGITSRLQLALLVRPTPLPTEELVQ